MFREHGQSPIAPAALAGFRGLSYFDYDPAYRLEVALDEPNAATPVEIESGGHVTSLIPFARTRGLADALGGELTLFWLAGHGGGAFLPFKDGTSGHQTPREGRYLIDTIKAIELGFAGNGRLVFDFNFAYFPSCAYAAPSPDWICPEVPSANHLHKDVTAGERLPA